MLALSAGRVEEWLVRFLAIHPLPLFDTQMVAMIIGLPDGGYCRALLWARLLGLPSSIQSCRGLKDESHGKDRS